MLKTRMGTTIEFIRLDEWVVRMVVSVPHTKGQKVVASPTFTIDDLRVELAQLEQTEPSREKVEKLVQALQNETDVKLKGNLRRITK